MRRTPGALRGCGGAALTLVLLLSACGDAGDRGGAPSTTAANQKAIDAADVSAAGAPSEADLALGPVSTFAQKCAICHGFEGMFFVPEFTQRSAAELAAQVHEMMTQNARLRPTPAEERAMVAFHRALQRGVPFAVLTNAESYRQGREAVLRGEVTADTEVVLRAAGAERSLAAVDGRIEIVDIPADGFDLVVRRDGMEAVLRHPDAIWSEVP